MDGELRPVQQPVKIPLTLCSVAWIQLYIGSTAILRLFLAWMPPDQGCHLPIDMICLSFGFGLLRLDEKAGAWVVWLTAIIGGLGALALVAGLIWGKAGPASLTLLDITIADPPGLGLWRTILTPVWLGVFCVWPIYVLTRRKIVALFELPAEARPTKADFGVNGYLGLLLCVLVTLWLGLDTKNLLAHRTLDELRYFETVVSVVDDETSEPMNFGYSSRPGSSPKSILPISAGNVVGEDLLAPRRMSGLALRPFAGGIWCEGYDRAEVLIGAEPETTVRLKRKPPTPKTEGPQLKLPSVLKDDPCQGEWL